MLNATSTCSGTDLAGIINETCSTQYAQSSSTDQSFYGGFTAGEIVSIILLFSILMVGMVATYHLLFRRIKIKNQ